MRKFARFISGNEVDRLGVPVGTNLLGTNIVLGAHATAHLIGDVVKIENKRMVVVGVADESLYDSVVGYYEIRTYSMLPLNELNTEYRRPSA